MVARATALTCAAGEHFVAYELSRRLYAVGLTRAGSPGVDLVIAHPNTGRAISIQVKTSDHAHRSRKRDHSEWWAWRVGEKAKHPAESLFYVFVSLERDEEDQFRPPTAFVVPAALVAKRTDEEGEGQFWFDLDGSDAEQTRNAWHLIVEELEKKV